MSATEAVFTPYGDRKVVLAVDIPDSAPAAIREGLARRRLVATGQDCPCGARIPRLNRQQRRQLRNAPLPVQIRHEPDCPAVSVGLELWLLGAR